MTTKSKLIIHIGTGKTATTFLQKKIFPQLQKMEKIIFLEKNLSSLKKIFYTFRVINDLNNKELTKEIQNYRSSIISSLKTNKIPHIISAEWLHGWDPDMWERLLLLNKLIFSGLADSVQIMISFRSTKSYLDSIYNQMILIGNAPKSPRTFYLDSETYQTAARFLGTSSKGLEIFCLEKLLYKNLFDYYSKSFSKTFAFKMSEILDLEFLRHLNICDEISLSYLNKTLLESKNSIYVNRSYSLIAIKMTYMRENLLNKMGFKSFDGLDALRKVGFKVIADLALSKQLDKKFFYQIYNSNKTNISRVMLFFFKIHNRFKKFFIWKNFMQTFINNFFDYKKPNYDYDFFADFKKIETENEDFLNLDIEKRIF